MINKTNWIETKERFRGYWARNNTGRPLMRVVAYRSKTEIVPPQDMEELYLSAEHIVKRYRLYCQNHDFLGESFPNISVDLGPGSIAAYLGSDIVFRPDTIWLTECIEDLETHPPLTFLPSNKWWKTHFKLVQDVAALSNEDFYLTIPDLNENLDVLAALRGAQNTLYDLIEQPKEVAKRLKEIDDVVPEYYNRFYDLVRNPKENGCAYTVFQIWGEGKTAKMQCDFSAMMSPTQFREFVQPSLRKQAKKLDNVLYHLDGPSAMIHMDALMEIDEIDALQWTSGDYGPDGTDPQWDIIYDKARKAGKSLWVKVYTGTFDDWIKNVDRFIAKYGSYGTFLYFPEMSQKEADLLLTHAEKNWSDIAGTCGFAR